MDNPEMESKKSMRILAVDDDETIIKLYNNILKNMGHDIEVAYSGAEAIEKVAKESFDMFILDLILPDITGTELLKKIKEKIQGAPVIIVTANPTLESSMDAIKTGGVYDYIVKPFESKDLHSVIQRAIEKAELINENRRLWKKLEKANQALMERVNDLEKFAQVVIDYEGQINELKGKIENLEDKIS